MSPGAGKMPVPGTNAISYGLRTSLLASGRFSGRSWERSTVDLEPLHESREVVADTIGRS